MYQAIAKTRSQTAKKSFKKSLFSVACASTLLVSAIASATTVDVLVVYDAGAKTKLGGEPAVAMQSWINQINGYYTSSQINIKLRLVGTIPHEESSSDMGTMLRSLQGNANIRAERDKRGADFVAMVSPKASCGIGYISVLAAYSYSISGPQCGPMTMAHELGHNMGLNHSRKQGNTGGYRYSYGLGHGVDYSFSTIMGYAHVFSSSRLGKFSNPNVSCNGQPCGIPSGKTGEADAARAINNVASEIAAFRTATSTAPVTSPAPVASKTYSFVAAHSGKCLDVSGNSKLDGGTLAQWTCHGGLNQQYTTTAVGDYMTLKAKHSGKCLSIENNSTANTARLVQATCNTSNHSQLWKFQTAGSHVNVVNRRSGKYLDIRGNNSENRAAVQQYSATGGNNQKFTLKTM